MSTMRHSNGDQENIQKSLNSENNSHILSYFTLYLTIFTIFSSLNPSPSYGGAFAPSFHCMVQDMSHTNTHTLRPAYCFPHYIPPSLCHGAFSFLIHSERKRGSSGENQQKAKSQHLQHSVRQQTTFYNKVIIPLTINMLMILYNNFHRLATLSSLSC